jgi:hypothetical protein
MPYESNLPDVLARFARANDAGLIAAGAALQGAVKREYNPPEYFIGAAARARRYPRSIHPTGLLINSVTVTAPYDAGAGARAVSVGTNVKYAVYWELGWMPRFGVRVVDPETDRAFVVPKQGPRRLLRHEVWAPAMVKSGERVRAAYQRGFQRAWGGAVTGAPTIAFSQTYDVAAD